MRPWYESWSARWQVEVDALRQTGWTFEVDEKYSQEGIKKISIQCLVDGGTMNLIALYPPLFPYFRPIVFAEETDFHKHQNPFEKHLCLLGRSSHYWTPDQTLADHISEQPPLLLRSMHEEADTSEIEMQQGEPVSDFLQYSSDLNSIIKVDISVPENVIAGKFYFTMHGGKKRLIVVHALEFDFEGKRCREGEVKNNEESGKWIRVGDLVSHRKPIPNPKDANRLRGSNRRKSVGAFIFKEEVSLGIFRDSMVVIEFPRARNKHSLTNKDISRERSEPRYYPVVGQARSLYRDLSITTTFDRYH